MNYEINKNDITSIRKNLNFTHKELAKRLRVSVPTIYSWENGTRNIPEAIKLLLEFYLISIYEISKTQGNIGPFGLCLGFNSNFVRTLKNLPKKGNRLFSMGSHYERLHIKYYG